jgi:hypothetical protein
MAVDKRVGSLWWKAMVRKGRIRPLEWKGYKNVDKREGSPWWDLKLQIEKIQEEEKERKEELRRKYQDHLRRVKESALKRRKILQDRQPELPLIRRDCLRYSYQKIQVDGIDLWMPQ